MNIRLVIHRRLNGCRALAWLRATGGRLDQDDDDALDGFDESLAWQEALSSGYLHRREASRPVLTEKR